jgi:hypothetical protein
VVAGGSVNLDAAAAAAFAVVFAREKLRPPIGPEISAGPVGVLLALLSITSPLLRPGTGAIAGAWPLLVAPTVAATVALAFVWRPFRARPKSGRVGKARAPQRSHLRVVRRADDLLN